LSSTGRGTQRIPQDEYMTQPWVILALLQHVHPHGRFLEPCLGSGNIARIVGQLPTIREVDWCDITQGRDFLTYDPGHRFEWIITNPPFSLAREFIDRSLWMADNVAILLRLNFLGSNDRRDWWQTHMPTALYVLTPRPQFLDRAGNRITGKNGKPGTDSCEYAWFVWSKDYSGIHVIGKA
jgi:hypothetical protein